MSIGDEAIRVELAAQAYFKHFFQFACDYCFIALNKKKNDLAKTYELLECL